MDRFISHEQTKLNISTPCLLKPTVENRRLLSSTTPANERFYNKEVIVGGKKLK